LSLDDELKRVLPVVREAVKLGVPISVDTYKPQVMQAVLDLGADVINDIWALRWPAPSSGNSSQSVVSQHPNCGVCLMHMHREPQTMQVSPMEGDVVSQVLLFFEQSAQNLIELGVDMKRIVVDPGIGFGKTVAQNFSLLARQHELLLAGYPLLAGWSRKSSLAAASGIETKSLSKLDSRERMIPSVSAALLAVERGARIVRVHDVRETVQALKVWSAAFNTLESSDYIPTGDKK
jgi:dihydropteroate synthase